MKGSMRLPLTFVKRSDTGVHEIALLYEIAHPPTLLKRDSFFSQWQYDKMKDL
jgi:hypothetical protein